MMIFFIQTSGLFFPSCLREQSWNVGFEQIDVSKVCMSSSELQGIAVGGRWVFSLRLNASVFFFYFYYCLLGVLSNLCSWANFYDWCGILQKLLSAKWLSVIPQNFSWWQIPGDWTLLSRGPRGNGTSGAESCPRPYGDRSLPLEKKRRHHTPLLPSYFFRGDIDLQFLSTFPDNMGTYSMFKAPKYSRLHFGASNENNYMMTMDLEPSGWNSCKRNFLQKLWEGLEETYSRSQIVLTFIFLQFSFLGSDSLT